MECNCHNGYLDLNRGNILLVGNVISGIHECYFQVNCIKCGNVQEIYERELKDVYAKRIRITGIQFSHGVFVREYNYVKELLGLLQVKDETIYEMILAIVDAYRKNYYMYWEKYSFQYVRKAIVTVLFSKEYDNCSKSFLLAMKKELKRITNESFCLEVLLENLQPQYFGDESQRKYGPAGVIQMAYVKDLSYNQKYLERKNYERNGKKIRSNILDLQKGIVNKLVLILRQNYKCKDLSKLKDYGKISLISIGQFVNDDCRDSIFLKGYSMVFRDILKFEFITFRGIDESNYKEETIKLGRIDEFVSKYLN